MAQLSNVVKLKTNFNVVTKHEAFYTGGKIQFATSQQVIFCTCGEKIQVLSITSGKVTHSLSEESDDISCFAVSPDDKTLISCSKNLLFRQWDWRNEKCTRSWKAVCKGPISCMKFDSTSTLLAAGSTDGTIKIWDVDKQYYTHNLKGSQGVISIIFFHEIGEKLHLLTAADDYKIRLWDLHKSRCVTVFEGHYSVVTSLAFPEEDVLISSSRDNVINIWDISKRKLRKTVPTFEMIEAVLMLPSDVTFPDVETQRKYFLTCGHKGILKVWDYTRFKCVFQTALQGAASDSSQRENSSVVIVQAEVSQDIRCISVVTADHNIFLLSYDGIKQQKQFVGYNDEILDMAFMGPSEKQIVVASNSAQVRLYDLTTMDCQLLSAHSDVVICVDVHVSGELLVTGSKDNTIRIWKKEENGRIKCVGVGHGHAHVVSCVAWPKIKTSFVVSGSQDFTIKMWSTEVNYTNEEVSKLDVLLTEKAHDKDINSIAVSPNDKMIATGSQDKTVKVWRRSNFRLLGTLRGHRRGVWSVQFSPIDQCIATGSADSTIRLWALSDFTCLKTLEGHSNSVLKILFISRGMQLLSCDSDGLIKLWTIKSSECVKTLDEHNDKLWSIAVSNSQQVLVSGGVDSVLNVWKDVTEEEESTARMAVEDQLKKEQELSNYLQRKQFTKALSLALTLEQPSRTLNVIKDILFEEEGNEELTKTLQNLRDDQIDVLIKFLCDWNTNAKHSRVSQLVLSTILKQHSPTWMMDRPEMKERIEALLPYTERHLERMNRLLQQSMFVEYTWLSMKLGTTADSNERNMQE